MYRSQKTNFNHTSVTCCFKSEEKKTRQMEEQGRRLERTEKRQTEKCHHPGHSHSPNMQFQAKNVEFRFCGSAANRQRALEVLGSHSADRERNTSN